jgi:thiamine monophosphate kinase
MGDLLFWDIYEISHETVSLVGVKLRGSLRKFAIDQERNLLAENASDKENCVRFALLAGEDSSLFLTFLEERFADVRVEMILSSVQNPVLSKIKVNDSTRYEV